MREDEELQQLMAAGLLEYVWYNLFYDFSLWVDILTIAEEKEELNRPFHWNCTHVLMNSLWTAADV